MYYYISWGKKIGKYECDNKKQHTKSFKNCFLKINKEEFFKISVVKHNTEVIKKKVPKL